MYVGVRVLGDACGGRRGKGDDQLGAGGTRRAWAGMEGEESTARAEGTDERASIATESGVCVVASGDWRATPERFKRTDGSNEVSA